MLAAFFAWLGGVFLTMNAGSGDPSIGVPYTLNAIAAAVIGGVALSGGRGTIVGAVAGALILSFINNLLFALGVNVYWQYLATGVLLLAALAVPVRASTASQAEPEATGMTRDRPLRRLLVEGGVRRPVPLGDPVR